MTFARPLLDLRRTAGHQKRSIPLSGPAVERAVGALPRAEREAARGIVGELVGYKGRRLDRRILEIPGV